MHKIGDVVWISRADGKRKTIICPDCGGTGQLNVTLWDGTQLSIDCRGCEKGYLGPQGTVELWEYEPSVECHTISEIKQSDRTGTEYKAGYFTYGENEVFLTKEEAEVLAEKQAKEKEQYELDCLQRKHKDTKTWSWNAHYHRSCIRKAEKDIEYHTKKLNVAKLKAKEPPSEAA